MVLFFIGTIIRTKFSNFNLWAYHEANIMPKLHKLNRLSLFYMSDVLIRRSSMNFKTKITTEECAI